MVKLLLKLKNKSIKNIKIMKDMLLLHFFSSDFILMIHWIILITIAYRITNVCEEYII